MRIRLEFIGGVWIGMALICAALPAAQAQNIKATIGGRVLDPQERAVPGVEVRITGLQQGTRRESITDQHGLFHQAALPPGIYRIEAQMEGFGSYDSGPLEAQLGEVLELEIRLQLAQLDTVVEVSAARSQQLIDNKQSRGFSSQEMNQLPVAAGGNGRNFYSQARTAPGVALSTSAHRPFAVSGQRPRNNNYMVDSVEMNDSDSGFIAGRGFTEQLVSQETVQSFEIITHNHKAEYGRNSGGVVSLVTKSGSNRLHGSLYQYHNSSALSARNPLETGKSPFHSNLFGFTLGGPAIRNKAFLFGNLEYYQPRGTTLATFRTLTQEERARAVPSVRALADLYPESPNGSRAFTQGVPRNIDGLTYLLRGDLALNEHQNLMLRTNYTQGLTESSAIGNTVNSDVDILNTTRSVAAHHSWILSPSMLNELRAGYMRLIQLDSNFDDPIRLGDPALNGDIGFMIVPGLSLAGPLSFLGRNQVQNNFQFSDDLSWTRGNHVIKLGTSFRRVHVNGGSLNNSFIGSIFFPNIDAFLAGQPLSYSRNLGNPLIGLRRSEWHSYIQDDWRITPNFTLNLGLRYELNTSPSEAAGRIQEQFRFSGDRNNIAPRLGFAFSMAPKTVLRGGYGIFYNAIEMAFLGLTRFNPPLLESLSAFRPTFPDLLERANTNIPSGLVVPDENTRTPYAQHLTLSLERQLWNPQSSLKVSYVGTLGRKLARNRRPNGGENLAQSARPDPMVGVVNRLETSSSSDYQALQLSLRHRLGNRFDFRAAYTYSRFLDDVSEIPTTNQNLDRSLIPLDESNLALDRGPSDFHIPHSFTFTTLYQPSLGGNNRWLGGWAISAITTLQSGRPYTLFSGTDNLTGSNNNRINQLPGSLLRDPSSSVPLRLAEGFSPGDLLPASGKLGTLGRNTERGDSLLNWNLSLSKDIAVAEEVNLQFRAEVFNLFNTANFDLVDNDLTSPSFGRVLEAFDPRRVQLALRLEF